MATTLAVPTRRAARAIAAGLAVAATLLIQITPEPATAAAKPAYGWPVKPFHRQHPVRGFFGDPRIGMTPKGMHESFHFGIDISCPNGTPVYATLDGVARIEPSLRNVVSIVGKDGRTVFAYWHIRPAVSNWQRVVAYETVIGHVLAPWEHVHFAESRDGVSVNPLRTGALGPFVDRTTPWVKQLRAEVGGHPVSLARGAVDLVVEAYDETPIRVPGRWGGKPVTPALIRWRLTTASGRIVRPWQASIDHRLTTPANDRYSSRYGRWTRQNKKNRPGRFRFVLQSGWDSNSVADGRYLIEVSAADLSGNSTVARFPIRVANRSARV
jgi:hypothetical protein